jgi:WD40 repeat protein
VLDADNAPVVRLSPLVQIVAPLPEHAEAVFVFAGPGRDPQASQSVAYPRGYERDDQETWTWFASHLLEEDVSRSISLDGERAPYPGLAAFTGEDHASFVGREAEVEELVNRLREQHLVAVVGASGVGKSSFLAAGVVPVLPGGWRAVTFRPGTAPIEALRAGLGRDDAPYRDGPHRELPADPTALADAIVALAGRAGSTLVVIVDQAEELYTMCTAEDERERFAQVLTAIAASERIRIVLSLRDDFLYRLDALAAWRGRLARSVHVLRMPRPSDLERAISIPARRCGYDFDDSTLPAAIVADVVDQAGALPLVAFAAAELWQRRDRHFKRLTRAAYTEIGGVAGALVKYADGVVDRMPAADQRLVRLAFRRLLTTEGTRASIGRSELVTTLGSDGERVIERLLAARLCVSRDDESGERIEIIHESLSTTWPRLAAWRHEDAASTKLQERLAAAARHWDERGRPASLLWRGAVLEDLQRDDLATNPVERAFAAEGVRIARRRRRRTIAAVVGAFAVLATGTAGLALANRRISTQRQDAIERLAASFEQQGRLALDEGDAPRAALFLAESRRLGARGPGGDLLIAHASAALEAEVARLGHTESPIYLARFERGAILAVGMDGTLRRWREGKATLIAEEITEAADAGNTVVAVDKQGAVAGYTTEGKRLWRVAPGLAGAPVRVVASATSGLVLTFGETSKLWSRSGAPRGELAAGAADAAVFDASGSSIAIGERDGKVHIFDAASGSLVVSCPSHAGMVTGMHFTADRTLLVTGAADREVHVCDRTTGALKHRLLGHRNKITALAASRDDRFIVSGSRDGGVYVWDLETGLAQASFSLGSAVKSLEVSPDGRQLATTARDGSVRIWDRESGAALGSLQGHASMVSRTHWEGAHLTTTSMDGSLRKWDVTRATRASLVEHGASITNFDLAGDLAVTSGADGRAIVWSQLTQRPVATLAHDAAVHHAVLARDLRTVATVDANGVAALWSVADARRVATLAVDGVQAAAFLPDGTVVTTDQGGAVRWWQADGRAAGQLALGFPAAMLTLDPQGRWLVASPDLTEPGEHAIVDLSSRRVATRLAGGARNLIVFGRDRLALGRGATIELVELGTWKSLGQLAGHQGIVEGVWFLPDGRLLSSGIDAKLVAWSREGRLLQTLANHGDVVLEVATSPDGTLVAAIGYEGTLRVFDAATLNRLLALPAHRGFSAHLQFTRDGSRVMSAGNDGRLVSWDLRHPTRSLDDLATLVRCRVPLALDGDTAVPRKLDLDDPTCRL